MRRQVIAMAVAAAVTLTLAPMASDARPRPRPVPRVVVAPPPMVYLVPGVADVFFYRSGKTDVFFAAGLWWTAVGTVWYQATDWHGPWVMVAPGYVPVSLRHLPARWHKTWHRWDRIAWRQAEARHRGHPSVHPAVRHDPPPRVATRAPARSVQKAPPRASKKAPARQAQGKRSDRSRSTAHGSSHPAARR